tara:strand:- start:163 stop:465 length:303 start_codon:yes stop_codon:yes gene_type:complete
MNHNLLVSLRNKMENMNNIHHLKFFEIIKNHNIQFSENRNGIFINMNSLNEKIMDEINLYISYVNKQEETLDQTEKIKNDFQKEFFKDIKDKNEKIYYTA